ncbi:Gfo/Idh/MocA family oxidoreductase [Carboxylicivirga mesophila]|uniref:Gfo/Idh/MocA family oxidoreductase n=1 Tax=Carboxylicivirga mesophila TaxID=1166478 RepID=A0ABS5KG18_9BACT|nr:Gfo/Idh/MocA family oxidoreductase [Carboxylicivirga mesophila]MBS2214018.1 Gfo/Idh/MocA family oxidoreductase [Carboxylicivirga mesophila]
MLKQINWGIIGCGNVTEVKSGPAFNKVEGSTLRMVMRRDADKAKSYARRHEVPQWTNVADELINHPDINAIYIATPPGSHAEYAIKAMEAGKAVYVEKPMAATYKQALAMLETSRSTGVPLFVAYYRRTLPGFLKVKELIDSGEIGQTLYVNMRLIRAARPYEKEARLDIWRLQTEHSGGGIFYDLASHQLDFLDYLFGPIKTVFGVAANRGGYYEVEDTVSASMQFKNGVVGNGIWSFVTHENAQEDIIEVVGTAGKIQFSGFEHTPIILYKDGEVMEYPYLNPENIQYNLIKQVVETLQGVGQCVSTGETAIRTNKVMQKIVKGFYE